VPVAFHVLKILVTYDSGIHASIYEAFMAALCGMGELKVIPRCCGHGLRITDKTTNSRMPSTIPRKSDIYSVGGVIALKRGLEDSLQ